ncbi:MAG: sugar phosphate isomerase/epimerase [Clostridia bacterium]|nr:sugar phosphate isomerase/epimerase [Clostridia bacterium]
MKEFGLVSVSFRKNPVEEIISLASQAKLSYIEWGSDIHVPETDIENAKRVYELTKKEGIKVSSYGTYYKLGQGMDFEPYLDAAKALGTTNLRVWAGNKKPSDVTEEEREALTKEAKEISIKAKNKGCRVLFEYHPNTLTETAESALKLITDVDEENCRLYWQPWYKLSTEENVSELKKVLGFVEMVHMFYWENHATRKPLKEGKAEIKEFMKVLNSKDIPVLLEFLPQDNCVCLHYEAQCLFDISEEAAK